MSHRPKCCPVVIHLVALAATASMTALPGLAAQEPSLSSTGGPIKEPFLIEHYVVHDDGRHQVLRTDPVVDYYGGSFIVSVRADGSRMVVDLERETLAEIDAARGAYWSVSFERFADLHFRLMALESEGVPRSETGAVLRESAATSALRAGSLPDFEVVELPEAAVSSVRFGGSALGSSEPAHLVVKSGVRRLSVRAGTGEERRTVEVWVDPSLRLGERALAALDRFEEVVAGGRYARERGVLSAGLFVSAARRFAGGAVPVRTLRPIDMATGTGRLEDVAVRVEKIPVLPLDLIAVPAGFERVPHPWEIAISATELERRIDADPGASSAVEGGPRR